jgi:uncharacterized protein (UPF0332 family)
MSYDWQKLLNMARELNQTPFVTITYDTETFQRTAINRAYYSSFIKARNLLRDIDGLDVPTSADAHAFVVNEFKFDYEPSRSQIGRYLAKLKSYRLFADYEDNVMNLSYSTNDAIQIANKIVAALNKIASKS